MKNLIPSFVALTTLLTIASVQASSQPLAQNVFVDRNEAVYPIPADADVIQTFGKATKATLPPKKWRFLVWNLHKGADETFKPEYLALSFNRDIIMNQEIFLDKNMKDVFRYLPLHQFQTATSFFSGEERIRTGVANISPVEATYNEFIRTEELEPIVGSPKVTLISSYPIRFSKNKLTVVNIHAINFVLTYQFRNEMERVYQAIKDIKGPLVYAGDFNTWNPERLKILDGYAKKLGLSEARFLPDNRITFNGFPLDHFLHTSDIKVTSARVDHIFKGSDHKPLEVEVEYIRSADDKNYFEEEAEEFYQASR